MDQIGATVVSPHDVFALVQIDVGDVASVHLFEKHDQFLKKFVAGPIVGCEWAARNVGVCGGVLEQAAGACHGAAFRGNATDPGETTEHGPFAGGQPSAEPAHRKAENRLQ